MTDLATPPASDPKETDKRLRERVDQLLARPAHGSTGRVTVGTRQLEYRVEAAFIPVLASGFAGASGEPQAAVMTTSYVLTASDARHDVSGAPSDRPVCFAFNGGPGSASIWVHLGALGPKRVMTPSDGSMPAAPYTLADNPHTWLEHFDLVFIDPPQTGWSVAASADARTRMLSVDGDVAALTEVVRAWLTRHKRWRSPVYLAGESYGTTRGAAMADTLQETGIGLSGLILISCAMDLQSLEFAPSHDLPYSLFLPAFANVSQYHGLLKGPLAASSQAARAAAEEFAAQDYIVALQAGARLDARQRGRVARRLAELTGLPRALVEEKNLRISDVGYFFEAMRPQGRIVGRLDARVTGPMAAHRTRDWEFDPGIESISAPFAMSALAYYGETLGVADLGRFEFLSEDAYKAWNWNRGDAKGNSFACTTPDLARAMRRNPHLKVLVASGRYDLGTPYSATDWSLAQIDAPAEVLARIRHRYYDAGHMMYTRETDLVQLKRDLAEWLAA